MKNSNIEWTDHTFNPWQGCTKVSPGCTHCYAETLSKRWGKDIWGKGKPRQRTSANNWRGPVKWNLDAEKKAEAYEHFRAAGQGFSFEGGEPQSPRVFCASMADWLDDEVPIEWLADLLRLIHETPNLDWLLLTKRPQNWQARIRCAWAYAKDKLAGDWLLDMWMDDWLRGTPPANVWIGTTAEDQERADERIPTLLNIPARVRFLSCEPMLGPLDIEENLDDICDGGYVLGSAPIHWVICGGESGHGARPMEIEWAESLADQCGAAGVPFFMKQLGGSKDKRHDIEQFPESLRIRQFPEVFA